MTTIMSSSENTFSTPVLTYRGHTDIVVGEKRVPTDFFQDRKGLWVYDGFRDDIATRAEAVDAPAIFGVNFHEVTAKDGTTDVQIESALGDKHLFSETQVCAIIAEMISAQDGDKEGVLLHNSYANLFYTSSLVVRVRWIAGHGEWYVGTWRRGGDGWGRGYRVFVPSN